MPEITTREILVGFVATIIGGVLVWNFTSKQDLHAQLEAIKLMDQPLKDAISKASRADAQADAALVDAKKAVDAALKAVDSAKGGEKEANRILSSLQAGEVFARLDKELEGLREIARDEVRRVVEASAIITRVETGTCTAERGALDYKGRSEVRRVDCRINFEKPFTEIPKVIAGLSELNTTGEGIKPGIRIKVAVQRITRDHAILRFETWNQTALYGVDATWIAIGR